MRKRKERRKNRSPKDTEPLGDLVPESWVAQSFAKRMALLCLAFVFLFLGVIGWLFPVVTGVPFYVAALFTLAKANRRVCRWMNLWDSKLPPKLRRGLRRCFHGVRATWNRLTQKWRSLRARLPGFLRPKDVS